MGQSLSEPKTEKKTSGCEDDMFLVGASCMQGWRVALTQLLEMEDAHTVRLPLSKDRNSAFFAVFDGHGGARFASYCSENFHKQLLSETDFGEGNFRCALKSAFLTLDGKLRENTSLGFQLEPGGTTAVAVLVKNNQIFCANVGDSRAIASVGGKVQELSYDHKPFNPIEESRIYRAGGYVEFNRVNGNLALSRAIGDFNFKDNLDLTPEEQIVTADPELVVVEITPQHEFIVIACDGVWDVMSNKEVVDFVRRKVARRIKPQMICEALLDHCLAPDCRMGGLGCDNMTVILACFLHGGAYSELARRCNEQFPTRRGDNNGTEHSQKSNGILPNVLQAAQGSDSGDILYSNGPITGPSKLSCGDQDVRTGTSVERNESSPTCSSSEEEDSDAEVAEPIETTV